MYLSNLIYNLLRCLCTFSIVDGARILGLFPANAKSHFNFNEAIMKALHAAGHHITFINPFPSSVTIQNYTVINSQIDKFVYVGQSSIDEFVKLNQIQRLMFEVTWAEKPCYDVMQLTEIQNILKSSSEKYDVMFVEMLSMYECYMPLAEKLSIPVIGTTSVRSWLSTDWDLGIPYNPSVVPYEFSYHANIRTFFGRLKNSWYCFLAHAFNIIVVQAKLRSFYELHFPDKPFPAKKKPSLVFRNSHSSFLPRALPPHAIEVAGIHIKPPQALPQHFREFINGYEPGVLVFSLGSFVKSSSMNDRMKHIFTEVFSSIPQRVIWKYDGEIENLPDNVLLADWIPQADILAHENVKAFISHCGIASMYEAIYMSKPVIMIPLTFDQMSNAGILEDLGVGIYVDVTTLTKQKLLKAINEIVNLMYAEKMRQVSNAFRDRVSSQKESVVYWTEYVIRHGGAANLLPAVNEMPFYEILMLDIIILVCICIFICIYCFKKLTSLLKKRLQFNYKGEKKKPS